MKQLEIIENFLEKNIIDDFVDQFINNTNSNIKWVWFPESSYGEDDGQFIHLIVSSNSQDKKPQIVQPELVDFTKHVAQILFEKTGIEISPIRIKLNAIQRGKRTKYVEHNDVVVGNKRSYSAILYLTDSDGETVFNTNDGTRHISCKKNNLVLFDSSIYHYNYRQTDTKLRVVLNMVFEIL